jgi:hypothetical protein
MCLVFLYPLYYHGSRDRMVVWSTTTCAKFIIRGMYEKLHTDNIFLSMYKIDETYDNEKIYQFLQHVYHLSAIEISIIVVCGSKTMRLLMEMLEICIQTSYDQNVQLIFKELSPCSVWYHLKLFSFCFPTTRRYTNSYSMSTTCPPLKYLSL